MNRLLVLAAAACALATDQPRISSADVAQSPMTVMDAIRQRRSTRTFTGEPISQDATARLCFAAQGITDAAGGLRASPSAGALYPLELYVVAPNGVFHYQPRGNAVARIGTGDRREALARAARGQDAVRRAGAALVITAVVSRTRAKYGDRAERYALLEAGHAAENVLLEATSLRLGSVPIGAFDDDAVRTVIDAPRDELPVYVIAVGAR